MKFNEPGKDIKSIPNISDSLIYFLLDGEDVVYVGQTQRGLSRPFHHSDKNFTKINFFRCPSEKLDYWEDYYIQKYKPFYNKQCNYKMRWGLYRVRKQIRKYKFPKYTIWDLRDLMKELVIVPQRDVFSKKKRETVSFDEYKRIMEYLGINKKEW